MIHPSTRGKHCALFIKFFLLAKFPYFFLHFKHNVMLFIYLLHFNLISLNLMRFILRQYFMFFIVILMLLHLLLFLILPIFLLLILLLILMPLLILKVMLLLINLMLRVMLLLLQYWHPFLINVYHVLHLFYVILLI